MEMQEMMNRSGFIDDSDHSSKAMLLIRVSILALVGAEQN